MWHCKQTHPHKMSSYGCHNVEKLFLGVLQKAICILTPKRKRTRFKQTPWRTKDTQRVGPTSEARPEAVVVAVQETVEDLGEHGGVVFLLVRHAVLPGAGGGGQDLKSFITNKNTHTHSHSELEKRVPTQVWIISHRHEEEGLKLNTECIVNQIHHQTIHHGTGRHTGRRLVLSWVLSRNFLFYFEAWLALPHVSPVWWSPLTPDGLNCSPWPSCAHRLRLPFGPKCLVLVPQPFATARVSFSKSITSLAPFCFIRPPFRVTLCLD